MFSRQYGLKDLNGGTALDKVLHDKVFNFAKNPKYHGYQRGLALVVYRFFVCFIAFLQKKLQMKPLHLQINLQLEMKWFLMKN